MKPTGEKARGKGGEYYGFTTESIGISSREACLDSSEDKINQQEIIGNIYENPELLEN